MSKRDFEQAFPNTQKRIDVVRSRMEREQKRAWRIIVAAWIVGGSVGICTLAALVYGVVRVLTSVGLW